ncbi:prolipoprotein diacylglyceryl transferase [archaeon]|jgi:phosphatidylglycerol---prolipoprotein diacylglyceryl transferase|nr:prolipoprotein diacylglyceryl transferase [archaeon]MBT3451671.1 prolipoprotein diacylglyceryl transferase [archaeon]MBT6869115.1 prolipoprotein diacylglyceryl transferase [archaeon]MBT7193358.1 prolipoprotein diacylglyceryl transferase [archaeon]MBT7380366.1 prolipoprotein diacylglyceryl transferase [archaeon]
MFIHNLDPVLVAFNLFGLNLEVRYYSLAYLLGFFLSVWWLMYWRKRGELNLTKEEVWDFAFYLIVGVIVGSRLMMVFWQPMTYLSDPLEIFRFWNGGMSFHGGLIGIISAGLIYCKIKKIKFLSMADLMSVPTLFALAMGRIANFINGELVGRITNLPWCVEFQGYFDCRHPSTLYAATKRFIITGWLMFLSFSELRKKFKPGFLFWNFVFWDGLGRVILDFFRWDILYLGLSKGQWLSAIMVVVSLYFFWKYYQEDWKVLLMIKN